MAWQVWLFIGSLVFAGIVIVSIWRDTTIEREVRRALWPYAEAYMQLRDEAKGKDRD